MKLNIEACQIGQIGNEHARNNRAGCRCVVLLLVDCERQAVSEYKGKRFVKWDEGKVPMFELSTYDRDVLEDEARVLALGADRYGRHNWHQAGPQEGLERYLSALKRHVHCVLHGERIDPDSNLPHTAHIRVNAAFLGRFLRELEIDQEITGGMECPNDPDDRIPMRDEAHQRAHDEYYSNDRKPMHEDPNMMNRCASNACTADLEDKGTEFIGLSGYHYCSKRCAKDMNDDA